MNDGRGGERLGGGSDGSRVRDAGERRRPPLAVAGAIHLCRLRLREQPMQAALAMAGIAAGVALLFAVQVAGTSLTGSLSRLSHGVTGKASLELAARGPAGMDQRIVERAGRLPGVLGAAPLVERRGTLVGPGGRAALTLVGVDDRLRNVGGPLVQRFLAERRDLDSLGLFVTDAIARRSGVTPGANVILEVNGRRHDVVVAGTLKSGEVADLTESPIAVTTLGAAQRFAGTPGRVSRVLVQPKPGFERVAERGLGSLAAGRLDVRASDSEARLFGKALEADRRSSGLFSLMAVVIGLLFAYNAMLLTMARRRHQFAQLLMIGARRRTVLATLAVEAVGLGLVASVIGVGLGDLLSRVAFNDVPEYLSSGFAIGSQRVVELESVALSLVGGVAAALAACAKPAIELSRVEPAEAAREREAGGGRRRSRLGSKRLWLGVAVIAATSVLLGARPELTPVGMVAMILGLVLIIGSIVTALIDVARRFTRRHGGAALALTIDEFAHSPARATALSVIVAGAVTATIAIGGAKLDLERGIAGVRHDTFETTDLSVTPGDRSNIFMTQPFDAEPVIDRLRRIPEIAEVRASRYMFFDFGGRRVLLSGRSTRDPYPILPGQIIAGDRRLTIARIRAGGWIAVSKVIARERGWRLENHATLPTPSGDRRYRLAATIGNYGWPAGAIVMNADDLARDWGPGGGTYLGVVLRPNTGADVGKRSVTRTLRDEFAVTVQLPREAISVRARQTARGLSGLSRISNLVLIAATLAIVAAMFAAVWDRRRRLAALRAIGMDRAVLYRTLFAESLLIVAIGAAVGSAFGLYCQYFTSRWSEPALGFISDWRPAIGLGAATVGKALVLTAVATAAPALIATRVGPRAGSTNQ